jgi:uncharacterized protein (DUF1778 family)
MNEAPIITAAADEDVMLDRRLFLLDAGQFDAFVRALDNPPAAGPQLTALMKKKPLWEK